MPTFRNISDEELYVAHLGRTVAPDEVVEVPADKDRDWPESIWAPVVTKKSTPRSED